MSVLIVTIIALATLAFGAVYPWGYVPLFATAALIGLTGLYRGGLCREMRPLALSLLLVWSAGALQLVPVPRSIVAWLSPATVALLQTYSLAFPAAQWAPLSIEPAATRAAMLAFAALALYVLGLPALLTARSLRGIPPALAIFVVPLALFGMYSRETQNGLIYGFWQPVETLAARASNQFGPFVNRNHYGGWILMALCLLVGWLVGRIERTLPERHAGRSRTVAWFSSAEANGLALMMMAVLIGVISLFWTLSRSAMLSFGAATIAFAWLVRARRRLSTTRRTVGLAILSTVLLAGVAWRGPLRLLAWFQDNNLAGRVDAWRDGWDVIRAFPWTGTGLNTYAAAMLFYQTRNREYYMSRAHNDYVQLLAEGGALVAVPTVLAVTVLAWTIRRNLRAVRGEARGYWIRAGAAIGLMAVAMQETLEFSLQIPVNALFFCTLAAIALAPVSAAPGSTPRRRDTIQLQNNSADVALP